MPPVPASSDCSCAVMVSTGFADDSSATACDKLLPVLKAIGTQTNFTLLCKGTEACHRWPQCGHCGSNSTYTVCALIKAPTVKPLPVVATASKLLVATGAVLVAAGLIADGASCLEQAPRVNAIKAAISAE